MLFDLCRYTSIGDSSPYWCQYIKTSVFHRTLAPVMDDQCTLLGLLWCVPTNINECINDMLKGVYVIVVHYQFLLQINAEILQQIFKYFCFLYGVYLGIGHFFRRIQGIDFLRINLLSSLHCKNNIICALMVGFGFLLSIQF